MTMTTMMAMNISLFPANQNLAEFNEYHAYYYYYYFYYYYFYVYIIILLLLFFPWYSVPKGEEIRQSKLIKAAGMTTCSVHRPRKNGSFQSHSLSLRTQNKCYSLPY